MKVITAETETDFERQLNEFENNHNVFATQTHHSMVMNNDRYLEKFIAVLFHKGEK